MKGPPTERYDRALTYLESVRPVCRSPPPRRLPMRQTPCRKLAARRLHGPGRVALCWCERSPRANPGRTSLCGCPRISAAWQFQPQDDSPRRLRGSIMTLSTSRNVTLNQSGFSRATSTKPDERLWSELAGRKSPSRRIPRSRIPSQSVVTGPRFDAPLGSSLGTMYLAGQGYSFSPFNRKHPREQQWRIGVQRQLSPNMSLGGLLLG